MITVTLLYPKSDDSTFDLDYYTGTHMPLFAEVLGDACHGWGVIKVTSGDYEAIGWVSVESMDGFKAGMGARGGEVMADIPNYTNVKPEVVMGDVVV
jgi:uncharacterized protein (TIGR02118 family)